MARLGEPVFPWADVDACGAIREGIRKRVEDARKGIANGRVVAISFRDETRLLREGLLDEFVDKLHRESRQLLVTAEKDREELLGH
ncbi:MAG: hypothetical protein ABSF83_14700 [Nitrososphaerales archaeon]|jgi:hypothetical protein